MVAPGTFELSAGSLSFSAASPAGSLDIVNHGEAAVTFKVRKVEHRELDVAGNWKTISGIGRNMQYSYIMKDSLTQEQLHEIHETLPADFQKLDHDFHDAAGKMAKAASQEDKEKVTYYYFRLTEACIDCHTKYATDKFPQFLK